MGSPIGMDVGVPGTRVGFGAVGDVDGLLLGDIDGASVGGADGASEGVTFVIFFPFTDRNKLSRPNFDTMLPPFCHTSNIVALTSAEVMSVSKNKENSARTT